MTCNCNDNYGCGGACDPCSSNTAIKQAVNDALAAEKETLEGYVADAGASADAAASSAADAASSASAAAQSQTNAETAASTATQAASSVTDTAVVLEETAKRIEEAQEILDEKISALQTKPVYFQVNTPTNSLSLGDLDIAFNVRSIYVEGARQDVGYGFIFDKTSQTITLADSITQEQIDETENGYVLVTVIIDTVSSDDPTSLPIVLASNQGAGAIGTTSGNTVQFHLDQLIQDVDTLQSGYTELKTEVETLASKLSFSIFFITPEMYGAKGDGVTDDRIPIQNALNEAYSNYLNKNGPTEVILGKHYAVSLNPDSVLLPGEVSAGRAVFNLQDGVTVSGYGKLTLLNHTGTTSGAVFTNWIGTADDVTIRDITIDAQYGVTTGRGITGINICDSMRVNIESVKALNCSGGGIYLRRSRGTNKIDGAYGCSQSNIRGCIVDNTYYIGIQCERPNMVNIESNIVTNTGDNGIDIEGNDSSTTNQGVGMSCIILGNNLKGVKNGVFIESLGNVKVSANYIITPGLAAVFNRINSGAFQCTFDDNTCQGANSATPSGMGVRLINQIGRMMIQNNKFSNFVNSIHCADRIDRVYIGHNYHANISGGLLVLDKVSSGVSLLRSIVKSQTYMGAQSSGMPYPVSPRNCPSNYPNRMASTVKYEDPVFIDNGGSGENNFQRLTGTLTLNTSWNAYARYNSPVAGYTTLNGNFGNVGEYLVINGNTYQIYQTTSSTTTITKWDGTSYVAGDFVADFPSALTTSTRRAEWGTL